MYTYLDGLIKFVRVLVNYAGQRLDARIALYSAEILKTITFKIIYELLTIKLN